MRCWSNRCCEFFFIRGDTKQRRQGRLDMRPILKGSTRKRSPNKSPSHASTSPQKKRAAVAVDLAALAGRRVTFSPFAKPRRRMQPKRLQSDRVEDGVVTSGFAFSAADDREVKRAARRKRDMSVLQTLYEAASKPRLSWLSLVEDHLPFFKKAQVKVSHWLRVFKEPLLAMARRRQNRLILRSRTRHAPTVFFDARDRQYVQSVSGPLLPPTRIVTHDHALKTAKSSGLIRSLQTTQPSSALIEAPIAGHPTLTPIHGGSLSTLLRKEGIPATEDESREKAAVRNDLRGVTHRSTGLKIVPHHQGLVWCEG